MSTTTAASNCFIDLATFCEIEAFLYGGPYAITLFVRSVQKANWFSTIPISLRLTGTFDFGNKNASASVNRSGDYVLNTWFRCQIPQIGLHDTTNTAIYSDASIRWSRNLMHNLMDNVQIQFNELTVQEFDNYWLDFNYQFRLRGSKRVGYRNMIGDIPSMYQPVLAENPLGTGGYFSIPFPFFFSEDSGVALPAAALPFNDVKININFKSLSDMVVIYPGTSNASGSRLAALSDVKLYQNGAFTSTTPTLQDPGVFAHYSVVHNDERVKMGDAPRDILIHQIQKPQDQLISTSLITGNQSFDLRLSHAISGIFFAVQNVTLAGSDGTNSISGGNGDWSNYTTDQLAINQAGNAVTIVAGYDPIQSTKLLYESTSRFDMGADYYSLIAPYFFADAIPEETGYHMLSYALQVFGLDPTGSTNYSKLANVSIQHTFSPAAQYAVNGLKADNSTAIQWPNSSAALATQTQKFKHILRVRNLNLARVANGSLGHPTQ